MGGKKILNKKNKNFLERFCVLFVVVVNFVVVFSRISIFQHICWKFLAVLSRVLLPYENFATTTRPLILSTRESSANVTVIISLLFLRQRSGNILRSLLGVVLFFRLKGPAFHLCLFYIYYIYLLPSS